MPDPEPVPPRSRSRSRSIGNPKDGNPKDGNPKGGNPKDGIPTGINNPKDGNPKDSNDGGGKKDTSRLGKSGIPWAPDDPASVLQDSLRSTFEACATANQEMEQAGMEEGGTGRRAGRWEGGGIHRLRDC